ncbi:hypothetical protein J7M23_13005, partial [Candidatus Sumerlaeota bacterium]|nr:hypothetical protein [Candidatus Sumerlaeota bacterium]
YFGNRIQRYVQQDMHSLREMGATYVLHTFSENDFHFFRGTMKEIVKISHDEGLAVYIDPWGVGKVFGGEAFTEFALRNPHVQQIVNDGKPAPMACPNQPEFRQFMKDWIDAAVETGADVLFWDEPHFYLSDWMGGRPGTWGCYCPACQELFRQRFNRDIPKENNEELERFRQDSLRDFLEEMIVYTHTLGRKNAICVLPQKEKLPDKSLWESFASISGLNIFGTDPYWYFAEKDPQDFVSNYSRLVMEICQKHKKLQAQIWIQAFKLPAGREDEIEIAFDAAVNAGIRNIAVWAFEACACMSYIRAERPEVAWDVVKKCFQKYHSAK